MWPWPLTLKFNRVLEVVEVHVREKFNQAECSGSWVINSALDFGQLWTSITNISETDQAIDKRKTALATRIFFHVRWKQCGELWWSTNEKMTLTFKFNKVHAVVRIHVHVRFHQAKWGSIWVIVVTRKKTQTNTILSVATVRTAIIEIFYSPTAK